MAGLAALAAALFVWYFAQYKEAQTYASIRQEYADIRYEDPPPISTTPEEGPAPAGGNVEAAASTTPIPYVTPDYEGLKSINPDTVGWVHIPDTAISYPVMQAGDNSKYLKRDSTGKKSSAGAAFVDSGNSVGPLDQNTVVYAHNMGSGRETEMFGPLLLYKERAYFEAHRLIQFDTCEKAYGWWEVFAVLHLDVRERGFNYLCQSFPDTAAFESWLAQARERALYDTGVAVCGSGRILTLSTCDRSRYGRNGRLVVMAVHRGLPE